MEHTAPLHRPGSFLVPSPPLPPPPTQPSLPDLRAFSAASLYTAGDLQDETDIRQHPAGCDAGTETPPARGPRVAQLIPAGVGRADVAGRRGAIAAAPRPRY